MKFNKSLILTALVIFSVFVALSGVSAADADNVAPTDNGNFVMTVPYNAGTGYHWEVACETYGVEVNSIDFVEDHPGTLGSSGTGYFSFHIIDDDYYVKLVLISPSGEIVNEVDSNMVN